MGSNVPFSRTSTSSTASIRVGRSDLRSYTTTPAAPASPDAAERNSLADSMQLGNLHEKGLHSMKMDNDRRLFHNRYRLQ